MKPDLEQDAADLFITLRCGRELLPMGEGIDLLETRLRAAYVAGLERAAEIADAYEGSMMLERSDSPSLAAACEIADSIRAEKEINHD